MRTPFGWTSSRQTSLQLLCACCALWGVPAAALSMPEQITPTLVVSTPAPTAPTPASTANNDTVRVRDDSFDWRVPTLIAMACLVGAIARWASRGPREPRVRLLSKPKKARPSVLVPPGPTPRLIPSDSPKATRARGVSAPVPRQTPGGISSSGIIDYIAPFADSGDASESRVDYVLEPGDSGQKSDDPPGSS